MAFALLMTSVLDIVKKTHYGRGMGILGMGMALGNGLGAPAGGRIGQRIRYILFTSGSNASFRIGDRCFCS